MRTHVTPSSLPFENLRRRPARTIALVAVVTVLAAATFGGSLLAANLANGMASMERRLGADLMVVPQNTAHKAEALLTDGDPSTFYFTKDVAARVEKADGIEQASEQTYIASLAASCCDEKLQIVGFDPDTDFVIGPWIASQYGGGLEDGMMIAGASVNVSSDGSIELYGRRWPVVAQLANTGTSLDNSVFINQDTVPDMVAASAKAATQVMPEEYADKAVSTVLIKVRDGYDPQTVAANIQRLDASFSDLGFVYPGGVTSAAKHALSTLAGYAAVFVAALWAMGLAVLTATFASSVNERKREFAALRIMGATRRMLSGVVVREAAAVGLAGGAVGVGLSALAVLPFSALIGSRLQLPYLQAGPLAVLGLASAALAFSVLVGVLASAVASRPLARREAYVTLREGQ